MTTNTDTSKSTVALKFPYPVLNDKRDLKEILNILNDKENELKIKMQQARLTYKQTDKIDVRRKEKLKQLYKNFKTQLNKIEEQLDFVKTSIKIKKINKLQVKKESKNYKKEQLEELEKHLNELSTFMKDENKKFLRESKLKQQHQQQTNKTDLSNVDNEKNEKQLNETNDDLPMIGPVPAPPNYYQQIPPPNITQQHQNKTTFSTSWHQTPIYSHLQHPPNQTALMNPFHSLQNIVSQTQYYQQIPQQAMISQIPATHSTSQDVIQTHLSGVTQKQIDILTPSDIDYTNSLIINNLAMTIAQTGAMAHAAAAMTAAAYNPPAPPSTDAKEIQIPILPTKSEINKAASTFANYKNKIKAFLDVDRNIIKYTKNSLKSINFAYENDDMNEYNTINNKNNETNMFINIDDISSEDDKSDTEYCIELESNKRNLNYILPSTNSHAVQVSKNENDIHSQVDNIYNNQFINNSKSALFTAQRSMLCVTFMGSSAILNKNISLSNILYKKK